MTTGSVAGVVRPSPRPNAKRVLICFSYCGGGTSTFRPWAQELPEDVELALICYPGRERRFTEPFAQNWEELLADAVSATRTLTRRPYVLFGHSMGAQMAFEVAARLEQLQVPGPQALVVSAQDSPTNWAAKRLKPPTSKDTDEALTEWMSTVGQLDEVLLAEPELRQMALDLMRADMKASETYRYIPGVRVKAPMQVLYGVDDQDVGAEAAERWRPVAAGPVRVDELPGGHFYTPEIWAKLPSYMEALVPDAAARLG